MYAYVYFKLGSDGKKKFGGQLFPQRPFERFNQYTE